MTIERRLSPEEELSTKQAELDGPLDRLTQNELELERLHAEINSFVSTYNAAVLTKVAEAKNLRARIAQAIYVLDPTDTVRLESQETRLSVDESERGSPWDIFKITTYFTSINAWRASALEQQFLFNEYFKGEYPANTLVEITALADPEERTAQR